ncbi:hypothetical protein BH10ACI3_BH10ACI3_21850 [soil metagenome]
MKQFLFLGICFLSFSICSLAQSSETFDIATFRSPKGWQKQASQNSLQLSTEDKATGSYCLINLYKSIPGLDSSKENFDVAWQTIVKEAINVSAAPQMASPADEDGWEAVSGFAPFENDGTKGIAMLVTISGFGKMVNVLVLTNTQTYEPTISALLESISLKKPVAAVVVPPVKKVPAATLQSAQPPASAAGYGFTTTNFDDGWTSTVQEDWVEVTKRNIKVLLHYPKAGTIFPADPDPLTNAAWNILVAPRYSNLKNYVVRSVSDYERVYLAAGNLTDNRSGRDVYLTFIRSGSKWIEIITPDKNTFVQSFGIDINSVSWNSDKSAFEPLMKLANYNKFAVAASDFNGVWTSDFTGVQQLYYVNTGDYAGMNLNQSSETFQFGAGNTYNWKILVVRGMAGAGKVNQANSTGTFKVLNSWQVQFSKIESGPKTYDAYFTCIKGARILWMNDARSPGSGVFTGFGKQK